jgi:hypothetical protein
MQDVAPASVAGQGSRQRAAPIAALLGCRAVAADHSAPARRSAFQRKEQAGDLSSHGEKPEALIHGWFGKIIRDRHTSRNPSKKQKEPFSVNEIVKSVPIAEPINAVFSRDYTQQPRLVGRTTPVH